MSARSEPGAAPAAGSAAPSRLGHPPRLVVARLVREEVHLAALRPPRPAGVRVDRDEEVGLVVVRDRGALVESHVQVLVAGQEHREAARVHELRPQLARDGQRDVLLERASGPARARVLSAVAGVDHHRPDGGLLRRARGAGAAARPRPASRRGREAARTARAPAGPGIPAPSPSASGSAGPAAPRRRSPPRRGTGRTPRCPRRAARVAARRPPGRAARPPSPGRTPAAPGTARSRSPRTPRGRARPTRTCSPRSSGSRPGRSRGPSAPPATRRAAPGAAPSSRARPSTGTSQRPPSSAAGAGSSLRSPSTEARLFLWCSTSSWLPRCTVTAPPFGSLVSAAPRPASTSSIATISPSARDTVATSRLWVAVRTVSGPPAETSAGARARRPARARRRRRCVTRWSMPFNTGSLRAQRGEPQGEAPAGTPEAARSAARAPESPEARDTLASLPLRSRTFPA